MNSDSPSIPTDLDLSPREAGLAAAVLDIVRQSAFGSAEPDAPLARFAFFETDALLKARPELRAVVGSDTQHQAEGDPDHLTSIECAASHAEPAEELAVAEWPEGLAGGYVHARVRGGRSDSVSEEAHDMWVAAGVLFSGETFTVVKNDGDPHSRVGRVLIPELVAVLTASLGMDVDL